MGPNLLRDDVQGLVGAFQQHPDRGALSAGGAGAGDFLAHHELRHAAVLALQDEQRCGRIQVLLLAFHQCGQRELEAVAMPCGQVFVARLAAATAAVEAYALHPIRIAENSLKTYKK